jgi:hypothetical protein
VSAKSGRRFTILDGMILVAATALGLAFVHATGLHFTVPTFNTARGPYIALVLHEVSMLMPFLTTLTLAYFVVGLLPPRPSLKRLARQPGMAACCAATTAIVIQVVWLLSVGMGVSDPVGRGWLPLPKFFFQTFGDVVPYAVVGAWLTLALTGRWSPCPNWADRLGRSLGVSWLIGIMIRWICMFLIALS